jgi:hypothetical protein
MSGTSPGRDPRATGLLLSLTLLAALSFNG